MDHSSYLLPLGSADIFFPTDFALLERMYASVARTTVPGFAGLCRGGLHALLPCHGDWQAAAQTKGA